MIYRVISYNFYSNRTFSIFWKNLLKMDENGQNPFIFTQLCLHVEGEYHKIVVEIFGSTHLQIFAF